MFFEFLIPRRPVSLQAKRRSLRAWKDYVRALAAENWAKPPLRGADVHLALIYLFDTDPLDVDNIIKPIQDALAGIVYHDDSSVTDVEAHRRHVETPVDPLSAPASLLAGISSSREFVCVLVRDAQELEDYL